MKRVIAFLFIFCCTFSFAQQVDYSSYISYEESVKELDYYLSDLEKRHVDLYYHTPKSTVQAYFDECKKKFSKDSVLVANLLYFICHSNHFWDNHTGTFRIFGGSGQERIFPDVDYRKNEVYMRKTNLRIDSINGVNVKDIIKCWMDKYGSDHTDLYFSTITPTSELDFRGTVREFGTAPYKINVTDEHGKDSVLISEGIDRKWVKDRSTILRLDSLYSFELYPQEQIGVIRYNEVFRKKNHPRAEKEFLRFFEECRKNRIQYLFIDVSFNSGGVTQECEIFFPYLKMNAGTYCISGRERPERGGTVRPFNECFFREQYSSPRKSPRRFGGQIFIYQSSLSKSAAPHFCAAMKVLTNALLVGSETGSGLPLYGYTGYDRLPYSRIEYTMSRRYYDTESHVLNRDVSGCLLPDIPYPFDIEHKLDLNDCKNIIELYKQNKHKKHPHGQSK